MSPNTEMGAEFCVQVQPSLNDGTTVSMMETQLWRDKKLPKFCDWLGLCSITGSMMTRHNAEPLGDAGNPKSRTMPC